jgi:RNA polymerase sigma-70 factor (ECF subfamily)
VTEPEHFAQIFDRHADAIHRYLSRRVGDSADDLLSETFLIAFRRRGDYRPERVDVRPWLYGIAANLMRQHERQEATRYRALARLTAHDTPEVTDGTTDLDYVLRRVDGAGIRAVLAGSLAELDPREREVLLLHAWADLSYAEIATAIEIPIGTVRSRLHRARRKVLDSLPETNPSALDGDMTASDDTAHHSAQMFSFGETR